MRTLLTHLRLAIRLIRDPSVPLLMKVLPILAVLYVIFPIDFVPDVLPVVGQLDDLGIMLLGVETFVRICPADAAQHHRDALASGRPYSPARPPAGDVIDAEWRRE